MSAAVVRSMNTWRNTLMVPKAANISLRKACAIRGQAARRTLITSAIPMMIWMAAGDCGTWRRRTRICRSGRRRRTLQAAAAVLMRRARMAWWFRRRMIRAKPLWSTSITSWENLCVLSKASVIIAPDYLAAISTMRLPGRRRRAVRIRILPAPRPIILSK